MNTNGYEWEAHELLVSIRVHSWPIVFVLGLFVGALAGQTPAPTPTPAPANAAEVTTRDETPTFQSRVSLVRVPVVVRDKAGKAVGGLRKEDFQIFDKGKAQFVAQFSAEGTAVPKATPQATPIPTEAEETSKPGEPAKPPAVLPTRFIAYIFDDVHLDVGDLMQARLAATKHMEQALRPTDRAAIYTLSGHVTIEFTDDVALFRAAMLKIIPVPRPHYVPPISYYVADQIVTQGDPNLVSPSPAVVVAVGEAVGCLNLSGPGAMASAVSTAVATANQMVAEGRQDTRSALLMLKTLASRMAAMPGDRSVILVSPGFYLSEDLRSDLTQVIERAARANVIINTLDARGLYTVPAIPDIPGCTLTQASDAVPAQFDGPNVEQQLSQVEMQSNTIEGLTLEELADGTGGTAFRNNNDLLGGFNRLSAPPEYIYYLGFYPQDMKPDGRYHGLKVTLANRKGLTISARKGYWAPSHAEDEAAQSAREIGEAVFSRDVISDLPIVLRTQFFKSSDEDAKLKVIVHVDLKALRFRKDEGRNRDDVTVVSTLFDRNGNFVTGIQKVVEMRLLDQNMTRRLTTGISVGTDFDVKVGAYMIRVVVRDREGHQLAASNGSVEIP
jgi:VWFA-related protein